MNHRIARARLAVVGTALALFVPLAVGASADAGNGNGNDKHGSSHRIGEVRFATFNTSLNRNNAGELGAELAVPGSAQPDAIAEIIQRARPDVLLLNEFDYDPQALVDFQENYLTVAHGDAEPIDYAYSFIAPSNTGEPSGFDYDNSGAAGDFAPNDSYGFGFFPGQFGMAVLSKYPIDLRRVRTFQTFKWKDMPGALLPDDPATDEPADWYTPGDELDSFRLSSKSHWDLPIRVDHKTVHFLVSHPTPPVFDDPPAFPEGVDFNGRRNHDEIRFWADYVSGRWRTSRYIYDDAGRHGGLWAGSRFVIAGDQNSDPNDGDSIPGAIQQLTEHRRINNKVIPSSAGAVEQSELQGNANTLHSSDPAFDTADFFDGFPPEPFGGAPGNLRADYVLPSRNLRITNAQVFWPESTDPTFDLVGTFPFPSSDHRLVWVDVRIRTFDWWW